MSVSSQESEQEETINISQILEEQLDNLTEKRTSTREKAIETLIKNLKMEFHYDFVKERKLTFIESIKKGIRKGSFKEQILLAKLIDLIFITLGAESEDLFVDIYPILYEIINDNYIDQEIRSEMINTLSIICFIGNIDELKTVEIVNYLKSIWIQKDIKNKSSLLNASLKSWNLLLTSINEKKIYESIIPADMSIIVDFLKNENVDIRVTTGNCIALLFEIAREISENDNNEFNIDEFCKYANIDINDLIDTLGELSQDRSKQRAKKDKLKQKIPFRDIKNFIENSKIPSEILEFKHQKFFFDTWKKIIQLDMLREILGQGLQTHFENNELLQEIFQIYLDKEGKKKKLSTIEKVFFFFIL